jgi:hypothetical protein
VGQKTGIPIPERNSEIKAGFGTFSIPADSESKNRNPAEFHGIRRNPPNHRQKLNRNQKRNCQPRVVGTHAHVIWGINANIFPSPSQRMGGDMGYSPTAWTPTPLVGVTTSGHPTDIVIWAARASADVVSEYAHEILAYWDNNASPCGWTLCWEKNAGPPLSSRRSIRERLHVNAQSEVRCAQWVCNYLAMSISPPQPHLHKGGSTGPMAPSPADPSQVTSPLPSTARPPTPAHSMTTAFPQHMQSSSSPSPAHLKGGSKPG